MDQVERGRGSRIERGMKGESVGIDEHLRDGIET